MRRMRVGLGIVAAVVVGATVVGAHHSHGNYRMTDYLNLKGTITEVHWLNPHSWVYLEVKNAKGEADVWALEGASVVQLRRGGWTADSLKVGDVVSVRCHQLRDNSNGCLLGFITPTNGVEKIFD